MSLLPSLLFFGDACMVAAAAWLAACALAEAKWSQLELLLAWGLLALMLVAGAGVLLGAIGQLGPNGFLVVHAGVLGVFGFTRRSVLSEDFVRLREFFRYLLMRLRAPGVEAWLLGLLMVSVIGLAMLSLAVHPVVYDSLTYRLSRIGHWLQDGRINVITTDDARLNFMPVGPDLVMAWLLGACPSGYVATALAQTLGGLLALVATVGIGRLTSLGRVGALVAALLLFGMPNVVPQFTADYTDLFTTGVLAAAFSLWLAALLRGEGSWLGGAGAGVALASKGTVVYFAPGLLPVVAWLAWRHRLGWRNWLRTLLGGSLAFAVFVVPTLWRNQQAYGGWTGPADFVTWHHGATPDLAGSVEKLRLNLGSSLAQLAEPNSQPPWWRTPVRNVGEELIRRLPTQDPYAFDDIDRRANLEKIYVVAAPDADVASTGVLLPVLGVMAAMTAIWRRQRAGATLALAWTVAIAGFVVFMHWRLQWHPYQFRFLVLASPWLAVLVAWGLTQWSRPWRLALGILLAGATVHGAWGGIFETYQAGWPAFAQPTQSVGAHVYQRWREWSALLDQPAESIRPALPMNLPLAAFYRQRPARRVELASFKSLPADSSEVAVRSAGTGWLIVPAARYIGKEGAVMARTWLYEGDERNAFSLAAYRLLRAGERPVPVVYRNRLVASAERLRRELLVRTWGPEPLRLELHNPGRHPCRFHLQAPTGIIEQELAPGQRLWVEVILPANQVSPLSLDWPKAKTDEDPPLEARLLP